MCSHRSSGKNLLDRRGAGIKEWALVSGVSERLRRAEEQVVDRLVLRGVQTKPE